MQFYVGSLKKKNKNSIHYIDSYSIHTQCLKSNTNNSKAK